MQVILFEKLSSKGTWYSSMATRFLGKYGLSRSVQGPHKVFEYYISDARIPLCPSARADPALAPALRTRYTGFLQM